MRRLVPLLCLLAVAGCGAERQPPANLIVPQSPGGFFPEIDFPRAGIVIDGPRQWGIRRHALPAVFTYSSGAAQLTAFAYRRDEPLPRAGPPLEDARRELVRQARRRNRSFALLEAGTTRVGGAPAVEILGEQTIDGGQVRTRSVHVYRGNVEYVFEGIASLAHFDRVDREVFGPSLDSLRVSGRLKD